MKSIHFGALRLWSMLKKEIIQMKREYKTILGLILIPFSELILFGYIINTEAKHLPTIVIANDSSSFTNSLLEAFKLTEYYRIEKVVHDEQIADQALHSGKAVFVINIPQNFTRDLIAKKQPHILIEGDGTDPLALTNAFHAASIIAQSALNRDFQGSLNYLTPKKDSFFIDTHANYNPALLAQYHTLPGLITSILTITLIMLTAVSITREYEQGTIEMLLITPINPLEVILGKIIPHVILAYILLFLQLIVCHWIFHVPFQGSLLLLLIAAMAFFIANLGIGLAISSVVKSQFSAANLSNTYILPALLFSGFLFPFYAMPVWAQWLGNLIPTTHFLRIIIEIMLKDSGFWDIWPDLWPILVFLFVVLFISFRNYRKTLD